MVCLCVLHIVVKLAKDAPHLISMQGQFKLYLRLHVVHFWLNTVQPRQSSNSASAQSKRYTRPCLFSILMQMALPDMLTIARIRFLCPVLQTMGSARAWYRFKARKGAKGDTKGASKVEPYAYWPLDRKMLNRRAGKQAAAKKGLQRVVKAAKSGAVKGHKAKRRRT